jgi:hypothetical protein
MSGNILTEIAKISAILMLWGPILTLSSVWMLLSYTNIIIYTIRIYTLQSNNHIFIAAILSKMSKNPVKIGVNYLSRPNEVEVMI